MITKTNLKVPFKLLGVETARGRIFLLQMSEYKCFLINNHSIVFYKNEGDNYGFHVFKDSRTYYTIDDTLGEGFTPIPYKDLVKIIKNGD